MVHVNYLSARFVAVGAALVVLNAGCGPSTAGSLGAAAQHGAPLSTAPGRPGATDAPVRGLGPASAHSAALRVVTSRRYGRILVVGSGRTVYHASTELTGGVGTLYCNGSCLRRWHPVGLPPGALQPLATADVPRRLGLISRPDGSAQVTYQGAPLYTYSGDEVPGDARGEGVDGVWSVVRIG